MEDYLRAIADLAVDEGIVTTKHLAMRLGYSEPSVTQMVRRLAEQGYVIHQPYQSIQLTTAGQATAAALCERYQVIEWFLTGVLAFDAALARLEADRIEHAVSAELRARMEARVRGSG
jgi:DtxR family Mn-dependent transcriptional regulator